MRLPSGEKWPSKCGSLCSGSSRFISPPAAGMVHRAIFPWWMRVKSSVLPSGDHWRCCLKLPSVVSLSADGLSAGGEAPNGRRAVSARTKTTSMTHLATAAFSPVRPFASTLRAVAVHAEEGLGQRPAGDEQLRGRLLHVSVGDYQLAAGR